MTKRHRDAGSGQLVTAEEAKARPKETVSEDRGDRLKSLEARVDTLERLIVQGEAVAKQFYSRQ